MQTMSERLMEVIDDTEFKKLVELVSAGGDLMLDAPTLYTKLYELFMSEMPYGTAKARTGDPDLWILDRVETGLYHEGYRWDNNDRFSKKKPGIVRDDR